MAQNNNNKSSKMHIRVKDTVRVTAGKEKGKTGKVLKVFPKDQRAIVEKLNFIYKHKKASGQQRRGGILEVEGPIHVDNLMLICPNCNQPTRIGKTVLSDGSRARTCKKCNEIIDR